MIEVLYTSHATNKLGSGDIFKIVDVSNRNNLEMGLTGFLIYADHKFFQVLEGPQEAVDALLNRLGHDPRHANLQVQSRTFIEERSFPRWGMKRLLDRGSAAPLDEIAPQFASASPKVRRAALEFIAGASPKAA